MARKHGVVQTRQRQRGEMNKNAFLTILLVSCILSAAPVDVKGQEEPGREGGTAGLVARQLMKLEQDRSVAFIKGDFAFIDQQTSNDYIAINPDGQLRNKAQFIDDL